MRADDLSSPRRCAARGRAPGAEGVSVRALAGGRPAARAPRPPAKGVALLTAMLIVALATVTAVAMAARHQINIHRTANVLGTEQAYQYALGVEDLALRALSVDSGEKGVDGAGDDWARPIGPFDLGEARVGGWVEDLQGRFNLNNLLKDGEPSTVDVERFDRLLSVLDVSPGVRQALLDWLDPDGEPRSPDGAEDEVYLRARPPRRTANGPMVSASELQLVAGVRPEDYERLAPNVVALPRRTPINLNTAPAPVLMAIAKDVREGDAKTLVAARGKHPFKTVEEILMNEAFAGLAVSPDGLSVSSEFFRIHATAESRQGRAELVSLVARAKDEKPVVLMRERGER